MRLPGPCAFTGWRRVVLPLAMLSVGAAVATGLVSISASGGKGAPAATTVTTPNSDDPEIDNQAATLVLAPANDDNFTPPGACGGTTIAPSRCTAAVWVVDRSSNDLAYSSTPCSTSPSLQVIVLPGATSPSAPPPRSSAPLRPPPLRPPSRAPPRRRRQRRWARPRSPDSPAPSASPASAGSSSSSPRPTVTSTPRACAAAPPTSSAPAWSPPSTPSGPPEHLDPSVEHPLPAER